MATAGTMLSDLGQYLQGEDPAPRSFTFDRLIFERSSSSVRAVDEQTLYALAHLLEEHPQVRVRVVGHDDGGATQVSALALARASAVVAFLKKLGISPERVEAAAGHQRSGPRVTELVVLAK
jgi:outer membrane protein OmpA-like peptidoglycan-associated protein